jgi:uncharacterized protein YsxB (DUF464 family)
LSLDRFGAIAGFSAQGHAERGSRGTDLACAAFSVLARTAYRSLEALPGIALRGSAGQPGSLDFTVLGPASDGDRAAGIADFLMIGLSDLAREYPDAVALTIERASEG